MISLRLNRFTEDEINDLISRLNVINPENTVRCAVTSCESCKIKHVCYSISRAIDYANAYLDGRVEKNEIH